MVDEAVDHGGGHDGVAEDLTPAAEGLVGGDDDAGPLVAGRDQLEEQVGRLGFEGDVADLVDDDERVATEPGELVVEASGVVGLGEAVDPLGRRWRRAPGARPGRPGCESPMARWVLPVPGGPKNTTLSLASTKSRAPRWAMTSRLRLR